MKDIFVSCSKEDRNISKKLVSKLEANGYTCYVLPRDSKKGNTDKLINESKIFILLLSSFAEKSADIINQIKTATEKGLHIIPFKTGKTENNIGNEYMLTELEWVDAYGDGFDEAFDILLEILEEINDGKPAKTKKDSRKNEQNQFEISKNHLYGIIGVLIVALIYFGFLKTPEKQPENNTAINNNIISNNENTVPDIVNKKLKPQELKIAGSWKMTDYEDSRKMTPAERKQTEQSIEIMKQKVLLTFNKDRSFIREGFTPQAQKGYWEYDEIKRKIYLIPEGTAKKEEINIINLTDKTMTFVVTETVETTPGNFETVTTKLTFSKTIN